MADADEGGFADHRRVQGEAWLKATPTERLRWLEEAIEFAREVGVVPDPDRHAASSDRLPRR
jgi:hypothetical protein